MLVAASDHGVQAGALLGALRAGQAAPLLLAWGGRREATSVRGQAPSGPPAARAQLQGTCGQWPRADTTLCTSKSPLTCTLPPPGAKPLGPVLSLK